MERICNSCHKIKPLTSYYSGRGRCKSCVKIRVRVHYYENREKYLNISKLWQSKNLDKARENSRRMKIKFPEKYKARIAARHAKDRGEITKSPCTVCGKSDAHMHHNDYSKPLDVQWLCSTCHGLYHRKPLYYE